MTDEFVVMGHHSSLPESKPIEIMKSTTKPSKLEFAVKMTCNSCVEEIRSQLGDVPGILSVDADVSSGSVVVETILPSYNVQHCIQKTGKDAKLIGVGGQVHRNLGAAVAMIGGDSGFSMSGIHGVVRFMQIDESNCIIDGTIDGLAPGMHGLHIHECGDLSKGCESVGDHYNPHNVNHGSQKNDEKHRHVGDLGNIEADPSGRAVFRIADSLVKVWDVIGRSLAVSEFEDDLGFGGSSSSTIDGNSGQRLACGIIARSAGLFENSKKICACDGSTLWDEWNKPLAGTPQQQNASSRL